MTGSITAASFRPMRTFLTLIISALSMVALAQTPAETEIVTEEVVPEPVRHLALTDREAMIDAWVDYEFNLIVENMVSRGIAREAAEEALEGEAESLRELIENTWYGRLESFANRDPRFEGVTDRELLDQASAAEADGSVCDAADLRLEFHNRNIRMRAETLPDVLELQQACGASQ
ncbi:MAG: hypothetical protein AAF414_17490 [Pseudomonadota bacterium]